MHIVPLDTIRNLGPTGPCADQMVLIEDEWPDGVPVCADTIQRAQGLGLDLHWFATFFLQNPAWAQYARVRAAAQDKYEQARAAARAMYVHVGHANSAKLNQVIFTAWAEYQQAFLVALLAAVIQQLDEEGVRNGL